MTIRARIPARAEPGTAYPPPSAGATWAQVTAWQGVALGAGYCPFCGAALAHEAALVRCPNCDETLHLGDGWYDDWLARRDNTDGEE